MRYAPKFLDPWQRINRMIEDRSAEAHAEIVGMAEAAHKAIDSMLPKPPDKSTWDAYNMAMMGTYQMTTCTQCSAYALSGGLAGVLGGQCYYAPYCCGRNNWMY